MPSSTLAPLRKPYRPVKTDELLRAFPAEVGHLMPNWEEIPSEFRRSNTPWNRLFNEWFYRGVPATAEFVPRSGVDAEKAFWHLQCVIGSYSPKHQHKEATVAYLASLWFAIVRFDEQRVWFDEA